MCGSDAYSRGSSKYLVQTRFFFKHIASERLELTNVVADQRDFSKAGFFLQDKADH